MRMAYPYFEDLSSSDDDFDPDPVDDFDPDLFDPELYDLEAVFRELRCVFQVSVSVFPCTLTSMLHVATSSSLARRCGAADGSRG